MWNRFSQTIFLQLWLLSSHLLCVSALRNEPAPSCSTSAPALLSLAGLHGSPRRPRACRGRAALWGTPGWGSPDSRWPAACGAPPAPPWRAAARWWGCTSRRCSPWSGSSVCDLWATRARRGSCTARTWGSFATGPGAETPEPPCTSRGIRSHSSWERVLQDAQVHLRRGEVGEWCQQQRDGAGWSCSATRMAGWGEEVWACCGGSNFPSADSTDMHQGWHALIETTSNQTLSLASKHAAKNVHVRLGRNKSACEDQIMFPLRNRLKTITLCSAVDTDILFVLRNLSRLVIKKLTLFEGTFQIYIMGSCNIIYTNGPKKSHIYILHLYKINNS